MELHENNGNHGGGVFTSGRKKAWEHKKAIGTPPVPEKNRGRTGKKTCKSVEKEENHEKGPRWSWARNQMGNPDENEKSPIKIVVKRSLWLNCWLSLRSSSCWPE